MARWLYHILFVLISCNFSLLLGFLKQTVDFIDLLVFILKGQSSLDFTVEVVLTP
jgi:hypothetical protein